MKIKIQTTSAEGRIEQFELVSDGKHPVQFPAAAYSKIAIEIDGRPVTSGNAKFKKIGQHLVVEINQEPVLEVVDFYQHGPAELSGAEWTLARADAAPAEGADSAGGDAPAAAAAAGGHDVSAATDPLQSVIVGADSADGAGISGGMLAALFGGGALIGGMAIGGGSAASGGGVTAASSYALKIGVVAGPVTHALTIEVMEANGKVVQSTTDAQGNVLIIITDGYVGALLIKASSTGGASKDYMDEATGAGKNLDTVLRAVVWADGKSDVSITVTPLTELAVRIGVDANHNLLPASQAALLAINSMVANAFGVDLSSIPVTVIGANAGANPAYVEADGISAAENYGRVLAALSGDDKANGGSMNATLTQLTGAAAAGSATFIAAVQNALAQGDVVFESGPTRDMAALILSTAALALPTVSSLAKAVLSNSVTLPVTGLNAAEVAAGVNVAVAVVPGAVAGDVVKLAIKNAAGVILSTVYHILTAAEVAAGMATVTVTKAELSTVPDGVLTIASSIINGSHEVASTSVTVVLDTTPPSAPSAVNLAAASVIASVLSNGVLGGGAISHGEILPVALPVNIVLGDTVVLTIPAGLNGVAQIISYVVTAADISLGYASVLVTNAQLTAAGDGVKVITAVVHDVAGNISLLPIAVATLSLNAQPPVLGSASLSMPENSVAALILSAVDVSAVSWSLVAGGADNALFTLSANGALSLKAPANFIIPNSAAASNAYSVSVRATDAAGNFTNQIYTVNVTLVAQAPLPVGVLAAAVGIVNQVFTLAGSIVAGAFLEHDPSSIITFSATGLPAGLTINSITGAISGTVSAAASAHIIITAANGTLTATQSFDFSAIVNTSNATLSAPAAANVSAAAAQLAAGSLAGGVNALEAAAGIVIPVAVATGAVAGDLLQVNVGGSLVEKTLFYILTSADITSGVVALPMTALQLASILDGVKSIVATFSNAASHYAEPALSLLIDQTPPNAPSTAHLAAAALALSTELPFNPFINAAEAAAGISLPVALPANSVAGDTVTLTVPAGTGGTAQVISYLVLAADVSAGFAPVPVTSAQLTAAADGLKTITASLHDAIGNIALSPITVASLTLDTMAPVVGAANFSMPENSIAAVSLSATDSSAVQWSLLAGGADNGLFNLLPSGALSLKVAANFEFPNSAAASNTYTVSTRATDAAGNFTNHAYSVSLTNVAQAPTPVGTLGAAVAFVNQPFLLAGSLIVAAFHEHTAGTVLSYSATGLPAGLTINSSTGAISGTATAASIAHIVVTASDGTLSGVQSFDLSAILNTSNVILTAPSVAHSLLASTELAATAFATGVNASTAAAGMVLPVAVATGVAAGDVLQLTIANSSSGVLEQIVSYIVSAADIATGVIALPISASQLALVTDGSKAMQATFSNASSQFAEPTLALLIDQTPPNAPSGAHLAAANSALALDVPASLTLGSADLLNGLTLPVALPGNSVAGDLITLTIPAGLTGVAQTLTHLVTATDLAAGFAAMAFTPAQLTAAGDGSKAMTAMVQDALGNVSASPIAVVTLLFDTFAPVITSSSFSLPENSTAARLLSATDVSAVHWALSPGGADNALFTVSAAGALSLKTSADFEKPVSASLTNAYSVKVRAIDAGGNFSDQIVTVNITNMLEAPTTVGALGAAVAIVNQAFSLDAGVIEAAFRPDTGSILTYSASGLPAGLVINSSTGAISGSVTSAVTTSITVIAAAGSLTASQSFAFSAAVNSSTATLTIPSAGNTATAVADAAASNYVHGVSVLIASAGIVLPVAVATGAVAGDLVQVVIKDANGVPQTTIYYTLTAADIVNGVAQVPVTAAELSTLTDGAKSLAATFSNSVTSITLQQPGLVVDQTAPNAPSTAHDSAAAAAIAADLPATLVLGTTDVTHGVTLPVALPANSVAGDTVTVTIPAGINGTPQTISYVVTAADVTAGFVSVALSSTVLTNAGDGVKAITAVVHDVAGNVSLTPIAVVTLSINTVAPVLGAANFSLPENSTAALTLSASDATAVKWSLLAGGPDNALFNLSAAGALSLKVAADFDLPNSAASSNAYSVAVRATDAGGNFTDKTYLVNITNVNEAPAPVGTLAAAIALVNKAFTLSGSLVAAAFHDPDAGTVLSFSASGLPAGLSINSATGTISGTVTAAVSAHIVVTASDGSLSGTQGFDFSAIVNTSSAVLTAPAAGNTLLAANQLAASSFMAGLNALKAAAGIALPVAVASGALAGDLVQLTIAASSGVIEQSVAYVLTGADVASGVLQLPLTGAQLSSLSDGSKTLQATFSNASSQFAEPSLSLLIDQTAPNAPSGAHLAAAASALALAVPASLTLGSADVLNGVTLPVALPANSVAGDLITLTIPAGVTGLAQTVTQRVTASDVVSGFAALAVTAAQLSAAGDGVKAISAMLHDALGNVSATPIAVVTLLLDTHAPLITTSSFSLPENSTVAMALSASDSSAVHWTLTAGGADNGLFQVSASGALSLKAGADFEMPASSLLTNAYSVKVRATDAAGNFSDQIVTVNISNVLEAPTAVGALSAAVVIVNQAFTLAANVVEAAFHPDTGSTLTYSASGLPAGLIINSASGAISGTVTSAVSSTIVVTAAAGTLTASQSFTFSAIADLSTAALSSATATNLAAVNSDVAGGSLAGGVNASEAAAGIAIPVAVATGALAGDLLQVTITSSSGVLEKTIAYILTAADITAGVVQVAVSGPMLATVSDGMKALLATFSNSSSQFAAPALALMIDQTAPNAPSTAHYSAAAAALSTDLPASLMLGLTEVSSGVTLPVALPANSVAGDTISMTLPASPGGTAQTTSYVVQAADVTAGFASIALSSAQLSGAADGVKIITASVTDAVGNTGLLPIPVATLTVDSSAPVPSSALSFTMPENSTAAVHLTASDLTPVNWSLVAGGADNGLFNLSPSGALSLKVAADFEMPNSAVGSNAYSVTVRATDAAGNVSTQTYTVNISNVNEAPLPVGTLGTAIAIVNQAFTLAGSVIAAAFHDPDAGSVLSYSALGLPAGLTINSSSGAISGTVSAVTTTHIVVAASDGVQTGYQGFDFSAIVNTSSAILSAPSAASSSLASADLAASAIAAGVNAHAAAAGIALPIAIATGAAAGDLVRLSVASGSTVEQTVSYILTSADISLGVVQIALTAGQLAAVSDGSKTMLATFSNNSSQFADPSLTLLLDQTPPNAPSGVHLAAAAAALLADLPLSLNLGTSQVNSGVTLPVALPGNSVAGDMMTLTIPAGVAGSAQTLSHLVNAGDLSAGYAAFAVSSAQLVAAGDGAKVITAIVHDALGNVSLNPIAVVSLNINTVAPVITTTAFSMPENSVLPVTLMATDATAVSWTLSGSGNDNNLFTVGVGGALSLKLAADFETPGSAAHSNLYTLLIRATDTSGNYSELPMTVNVTNVNEAPLAVSTLGTQVALVNQLFTLSASTVAGAFHDPDAGTILVYSISGEPAGVTINSSTGAISGTITSVTTTPYHIVVSASDGQYAVSQAFDLSAVIAPAFTAISDPSAAAFNKGGDALSFVLSVSEAVNVVGTPGLTLLMNGVAISASYVSGSGSNSLIFSATAPASGDGAATSISAITLPTGASITGVASHTALATGVVGQTTASVSIDNTAPLISTTSFSLPENSVAAMTLAATDASVVSWALSGTGSDNGLFTVSAAGALSLKTAANFEAPGSAAGSNAYSVLVAATDLVGHVTTQLVTVNITNVNETPVLVGMLANTSAIVNQTFTLAGSIVAGAFSDPDAGTIFSYSISGQPSGISINSSTGAITGVVTAISSVPYHIIVSASDGQFSVSQSFDLSARSTPVLTALGHAPASNKGGDTLLFTVTISEAVTISGLPTLTMAMNGVPVTAQYSAGSGTSNLTFSAIVPASGDGSAISVSSVNFPNGASATGISSGLGLSGSVNGVALATVVIDNTAPLITTTSLSLPENSTAPLTLAATDITALSWALVSGAGGDNALFNLTSGGTLSLKTAANFEAPGSAAGSNVYSVSVSATDIVGHVTTQLVTVNIINVNEAPAPFGTLANFSTGLNQNFTITAATIAAAFVDPDAGTVWLYSISGQPAGVSINPTTGAVSGLMNAVTSTPYHIIISASDGQYTATQAFDLSAHPVPTILALTHAAELDAGGAFLNFGVTLNEAVTVSMPNQAPTLTLNMNGQLVSALYLSGSGTSNLIFQAQLPLTGDGSSIFISAITVPSDAAVTGLTTGLGLATNILGQSLNSVTIDNTAPLFGNDTFSLPENSVAPLTLTATDLSALQWTLAASGSSNDNSLFALSTSGALSLITAADFETPSSHLGTNAYSVLVDVTDAVNHKTEHLVTVNITNVNEPPVPIGTLPNVVVPLNTAYDLPALTVAGAFRDPDAGTNLVYSATGLVHGLTINSATGEITGTPDVATTSAAHIVISASDGQYTAVQPFDLSVVAPMHLSSAVNGLTNLDVMSNIVLGSTDTVSSAVAGKHIHLVSDSSPGYDVPAGSTVILNSQDILASDTSQVTIVNGQIVINPLYDLDFSSNYHITVDAGAFLGAGGEPSAAISDPLSMHFASVTPGVTNGNAPTVSNAAASQIMASDGTLSASYNWLSMANISSVAANTHPTMDMGSGMVALLFRNDSPFGSGYSNPADPTTENVGIQVGNNPFDFNVTNFNKNDLIYADSQTNPPQAPIDTAKTSFGFGSDPLQLAWDPSLVSVNSQGQLYIVTYLNANTHTVVTTAGSTGANLISSIQELSSYVLGNNYTGHAIFITG